MNPALAYGAVTAAVLQSADGSRYADCMGVTWGGKMAPDGQAAPGRHVRGENGRREPVPEAITRIMLRPVASSLPLGFLAFSTESEPGIRRQL